MEPSIPSDIQHVHARWISNRKLLFIMCKCMVPAELSAIHCMRARDLSDDKMRENAARIVSKGQHDE